jgi:hypothetical protein
MSSPVDPLQEEMMNLRNDIVKLANERTLAAIEEHLSKIVVPVEELKSDILRSAKNIENACPSAAFRISLSELLTAEPSYELYITKASCSTYADKVVFHKDFVSIDTMCMLFLGSSHIKGMRRIYNELTKAFPGAIVTANLIAASGRPGMVVDYKILYNNMRYLKNLVHCVR